ncbi:MAG: GCN5-related N-acetyltransferase [Nocardioides sp.]|jgi:GNAT superfamily N-acetyltransferase|nr:GCN5-related N-acetyltransferase [Nocardioides sp.]
MTASPDAAPYALEFTEDAASFRDAAGAHLALDPVLTTVVSTVTDRAVDADARGVARPAHPRWWVTVRQGGEVVGAAMRTAPFEPHPLFVLPMPEEAARELARALVARGEPVTGVNGALPATRTLAEETAALSGGAASVVEHTRLFELGDLVAPRPVPGQLRAATVGEVGLALAWFGAFGTDAAEQAGRGGSHATEDLTEPEMLERIEDGRIWLWEDVAGEVVHLTAYNPPSYGVARVGPVYTPKEQRGRGYASAAVAALSRRLQQAGHRVCLFTDQANPTSNKIYQALGFRPVVDMANLVITTPAGRSGEPGP